MPKDWIEQAEASRKTGAQIAEEHEPKGTLMAMNDTFWVGLRYAAIGVGSFMAGKGWVTMDQVNTVIERAPEVGGAIVAAGTAIWGLWVRWNTKAVPAKTAARDDVPTINPVTGSTVPGPK